MIKKSITYEDYDGNKQTREFYFGLNKAELIKLDVGNKGGLQKTVERLMNEQDTEKIYELFETIIQKSIGKKTDDGQRFTKSKEITDAFVESPAYSELIIEMIQNPEAASAFITGILPKDLQESAKQVDLNA